MLTGTARAIGPDFERKVLLLDDPESQPQKEQRLARQPEDFVKCQGARIHDQRLDERLSDAAALLIVPDRKSGDLPQRRAVDLDAAGAPDRAGAIHGDHILLD